MPARTVLRLAKACFDIVERKIAHCALEAVEIHDDRSAEERVVEFTVIAKCAKLRSKNTNIRQRKV